jgi:hypothetical protein
MSEPAVYRCSLCNGRVSYLVCVMGLLTAGVLAGLLGGGVADRGAGQLLAWLGAIVLVIGPTVAYLLRTRIVIDAERVRVHTLVGEAGSARRTDVAQIIAPRSGIGFFVDAEGKVLVPFRDAYTRAQLAAMASELRVDLATTGKSK